MFGKQNSNSQYYSKSEIIKSTRILSVLSGLLFLMFAVIDIWAISSVASEVLLIRGAVVTCLAITYFITYIPSFYKYKDAIISSIILISALGIEYMIYRARPDDHAYSVYFVGIVLILMTLYSWTYVRFTVSMIVTAIIVSGYISIEMFTRHPNDALSIPELATNLLFICSAIVIGVIARLMRDRFIRDNVLLQQSLASALQEKTVEAEDYAYEAHHDVLTGLPNRRYVTEQLEKSLEIAKEKDNVLVILFIDLNGFKQINDIYGHAAGDEVLCIVAKRLELAIRKGDSLSRLGGDEYLIGLMMEKENLAGIEEMVGKYVNIISDPMNIEGSRLKVGASIGIAAYPIHGNKINVLMDIADQKMYQVKNGSSKPEKPITAETNKTAEPVIIFPGCRFKEIVRK